MKLVTIFDLDGVLVDNVGFERAVSEDIARAISERKDITVEEALARWSYALASNSQNPRWHDYSYHCAALGVPDAWRVSHLAMQHLIRPMPNAAESIDIAHRIGKCWLASDATRWVVELKLHVTGIDLQHFDEVFTLDSCGMSKGFEAFWKYLLDRIGDSNVATIYIDNRLDRLLAAKNVLPNCKLILVNAEDHPSSLRLFSQPSDNGVHLSHATHAELPDVLRTIATEFIT